MKKAPAPSFESFPASGNTASDPTDRVAVTAREVTYEDPKHPTLKISRTTFKVNGETIVFIGAGENKEEVLGRIEEALATESENGQEELRAIGTSAEEILIFAAEHCNNPYIVELKEAIKNKDYTQATLGYFDAVFASLCLGPDGEPLEQLNTDALGDVLAALLGDDEKQDEIYHKLKQLRELRSEYAQSLLDKQNDEHKKHLEKFPRLKDITELKPENVVLVHVTKYPPMIDEQGNIVLYPTANYDMKDEYGAPTDYKVARGTIHFTVNSRVENHLGGSGWEGDNNYVIIANLASTLESGVTPVAANYVDTYFESNPGEPLVLPGAILLKPIEGESFEENIKRVQEAMVQAGAEDIYKAGAHYLTGGSSHERYKDAEDFQHAFNAMCVEEGIRIEGLHLGSSDELVETAFYGKGTLDIEDVKPETFIRACAANQRWAVLNGVLPTAKRTSTLDSLDFAM